MVLHVPFDNCMRVFVLNYHKEKKNGVIREKGGGGRIEFD